MYALLPSPAVTDSAADVILETPMSLCPESVSSYLVMLQKEYEGQSAPVNPVVMKSSFHSAIDILLTPAPIRCQPFCAKLIYRSTTKSPLNVAEPIAPSLPVPAALEAMTTLSLVVNTPLSMDKVS